MRGKMWQYIVMLTILVYYGNGKRIEDRPVDVEAQASVQSINDQDLSDVKAGDIDEVSRRSQYGGMQKMRPTFCYFRPERGLCGGTYTRFYYEPITGTCSMFLYSGCAGNQNRFLTYWQCMKICKPY